MSVALLLVGHGPVPCRRRWERHARMLGFSLAFCTSPAKGVVLLRSHDAVRDETLVKARLAVDAPDPPHPTYLRHFSIYLSLICTIAHSISRQEGKSLLRLTPSVSALVEVVAPRRCEKLPRSFWSRDGDHRP